MKEQEIRNSQKLASLMSQRTKEAGTDASEWLIVKDFLTREYARNDCNWPGIYKSMIPPSLLQFFAVRQIF